MSENVGVFRRSQEKIRRAQAVGGNREVLRRAKGLLWRNPRSSERSALSVLIGLRMQVCLTAKDAIYRLADMEGLLPPEQTDINRWEAEASRLMDSIGDESRGPFSPEYDLGRHNATFLYCLVRWIRPASVVESGVARGVSTLMVLSALNANRHGRLTSFDVRPDVGQVVPKGQEHWELVVLPVESARKSMDKHVMSMEPIDMFIHDSDHSSQHQSFEYELAARSLVHGGFLVSDDIDASPAFSNFCRSRQLASVAIVDDRKIGAVTVPNH